jgi:hypothetical protein
MADESSLEDKLQELSQKRRARKRRGLHHYPCFTFGIISDGTLVDAMMEFGRVSDREDSFRFIRDASKENFLDPQSMSKKRTTHYYNQYFDMDNAPYWLNLPTDDQRQADSLFGPNRSAPGAAARYPQRDFLIRCLIDICDLMDLNGAPVRFYASPQFKGHLSRRRFGPFSR